MNGVCCKRLLLHINEIMDEILIIATERIKEGQKENFKKKKLCSIERLTSVMENYINLFKVMDVSFSMLRITAPKNVDIEETKKAVVVLEKMWKNLKLSITPKAHIMFKHAVPQYELYGGLADKVEDFVEKAHQEGKRLEYLTSRIPSQCYEKQQLIQMYHKK